MLLSAPSHPCRGSRRHQEAPKRGSCCLWGPNHCLVLGQDAWGSAAPAQGWLQQEKPVRKSTGGFCPGLGAVPAVPASPAGPLAQTRSCPTASAMGGHPGVCGSPWSCFPSWLCPGAAVVTRQPGDQDDHLQVYFLFRRTVTFSRLRCIIFQYTSALTNHWMENFLYINEICLMGKDITIEKSSFSIPQN